MRNLDSLGKGYILRNLDSLGKGNILRNLDSLGKGNILRNLDTLGNGNILRNLDSPYMVSSLAGLDKESAGDNKSVSSFLSNSNISNRKRMVQTVNFLRMGVQITNML